LSDRLSKRIYLIGAGLALALLVIAAGALLMLRQRGDDEQGQRQPRADRVDSF
jgi:hypothetical protein